MAPGSVNIPVQEPYRIGSFLAVTERGAVQQVTFKDRCGHPAGGSKRLVRREFERTNGTLIVSGIFRLSADNLLGLGPAAFLIPDLRKVEFMPLNRAIRGMLFLSIYG